MKCQGGVDEAEDVYSEPDHHSDSGDSSGSNYESGSSFEDAAKKNRQGRKVPPQWARDKLQGVQPQN